MLGLIDGLARRSRRLHQHALHLCQRRRRLFETGGIALGTPGEVIRRQRDLVGAGADAVTRIGDRCHQLAQITDRAVIILLKLFIVIRKLFANLRGQISIRHRLQVA
ncbi:hypothetical protein D9M73_123590 [compost metagenome]